MSGLRERPIVAVCVQSDPLRPCERQRHRSRLLYSPIAVATDAHAVAAAAGELHGPGRTSIGARPERRASSPAYRMMDRVVVADRGVDSPLESQVTRDLVLVSVHTAFKSDRFRHERTRRPHRLFDHC
jgi:hypothetical protein